MHTLHDRSRFRRWRAAVVAVAVAIQVSCGGGDPSEQPTPPANPAAITAISTTTLTGTAGLAVATLPSVRVTSSSGSGVAGVTVTFAVTSGGGSVTGGTATTDANGVATVGGWTLGAVAGVNTMTARVALLNLVTFTATSTAGPATSVTISPTIAAAAPNAFVNFVAQSQVGAPAPATWRVNGIVGGTQALGLISAAGKYTAPRTIPDGDSVVVSAVLASDTTQRSASTVFFVPNLATKNYYVPIPRVVDTPHPQPMRFLLVPPEGVTAVNYLPSAGPAVPLTDIGNGVLSFQVDAATALVGYQIGTLHNVIGRLDYRTAAGTSFQITNLSVNVRDATMPDVVVTPVAADAQRSPYVLNIRVDTATINAGTQVVAHALQLLGGDRFDFVDVVASVTTNNNRNYVALRNDITGIGVGVFDNSAIAGGTGRLRGMISFPLDGFFDGAELGFIHEAGHSWINFATDPVLASGAPHWPASTMALGVMGLSIPASGAGGQFPWALTPIGHDSVRINRATPNSFFTPLDLYLMGLIPTDSVPPVYVLPLTIASPLVDGMQSPATTYTIADYVAKQGPRVPASAAAPRTFATAVVVLTYGRLMTESEMTFFDMAASRAETIVLLRSTAGLVTVDAPGFFLATGRRATMRTRLP